MRSAFPRSARGSHAACVLLTVGACLVHVSTGHAAPVLAAAGDIACSPTAPAAKDTCHQMQTSSLLVAASPTVVTPLGDNQYENASLAEYQAVYEPSWGRVRSLSRPVAGNHEYVQDQKAGGYFSYFADQLAPFGPDATAPTRGWYSYDVGAWHVIALNSNCDDTSCGARNQGVVPAAEVDWLRADLAAHPARCTAAYWHHPRFASDHTTGDSPGVAPLWDALEAAGADVVLAGHAHQLEIFAQQDASGRRSAAGIREFVVGTGGEDHGDWFANTTFQPNSIYHESAFGVLFLTLRSGGYDWRFQHDDRSYAKAPGSRGSTTCHSAAALHGQAVAMTRSLPSRATALARRSILKLPFEAPAAGSASVVLRAGRVTLAGGRITAAAQGSTPVSVRLTAAGRRALRRGGARVRVVVRLAFTPQGAPAGQQVSAKRTLKR